jgi:hypothetical protein
MPVKSEEAEKGSPVQLLPGGVKREDVYYDVALLSGVLDEVNIRFPGLGEATRVQLAIEVWKHTVGAGGFYRMIERHAPFVKEMIDKFQAESKAKQVKAESGGKGA